MHKVDPHTPRIFVSFVTTEYVRDYHDNLYSPKPITHRTEYTDIYQFFDTMYNPFNWYHNNGYHITTESEKLVTFDDLPKDLQHIDATKGYVRWHWRSGSKPSYRAGYYKKPKTTNEGRAYYNPDINEYKVKVRGKRRANALPDVYWDKPKGDSGRNWKQYRKHQWKSH